MDKGYEKPQVTDFGTLVDLTASGGVVGSEDGIGKTIQATVDNVVEASVGLLP